MADFVRAELDALLAYAEAKGVKLHEYWCKPNETHPEGRRAVWCKGKILFEGPNPYEVLPYVMFTGIPIPGRFWPTSTRPGFRNSRRR